MMIKHRTYAVKVKLLPLYTMSYIHIAWLSHGSRAVTI